MSDNMFDFGFTAVTEDELQSVQSTMDAAKSLQEDYDDLKTRFEQMYNAIAPLLANLKKNPEKEYIYWPDRLAKVEKFEDHILMIYGGKEEDE